MLLNSSLDIILSLFLQDMLKVGMERRLHIPPGSAYTKMFPDPRSGECKYQTCVWADTSTYKAELVESHVTVACDPFHKHQILLAKADPTLFSSDARYLENHGGQGSLHCLR